MNFPSISIVTPSYNQGQFLEETLLSIINQQYPNLELIVIDGGSTDNSIEVIKKYREHISYWVSEKDNGQSDAINKGFRIARGEIINWINSDDILTDGALITVGNIFAQLPDDTGLIHGGTEIFGNGIQTIDFGYETVNAERYLAGIAFPQPSAFFRRELLDKTGLLDESFHFQMDYDLYSKMILFTRFLKVNKIFSRYRLHAGSKTVSQAEKFADDSMRIISRRAADIHSTELIEKLKEFGLFKTDSGYKPLDNVISKYSDSIMINRVLFYFFAYMLKFDYSAGRLKRARTMLQYLKRHFDFDELMKEKDLNVIVPRLQYLPDFVIKFMRNFRNK